jgi:TolA-binding protein
MPPAAVPNAAAAAQNTGQAPAASAIPNISAESDVANQRAALQISESALPDAYFKKAREEFEAGRVAGAIMALDLFRERFPSGSDEAWWLLGQFYEANSPSRDIRSSLDYYRRLIREYPQSQRYDAARRRIAYLERFYINIQ